MKMFLFFTSSCFLSINLLFASEKSTDQTIFSRDSSWENISSKSSQQPSRSTSSQQFELTEEDAEWTTVAPKNKQKTPLQSNNLNNIRTTQHTTFFVEDEQRISNPLMHIKTPRSSWANFKSLFTFCCMKKAPHNHRDS